MPCKKKINGNLGTKADFKLRKDLQPIRKLDDSDLNGNTNGKVSALKISEKPPAKKTKEVNMLRPSTQDLQRSNHTHLLITSLLEQMCRMTVEDPDIAQELFKNICKDLVKLKVISPLNFIDETSSLRARYRLTLHNMIHQAIAKQTTSLTPMIPLTRSLPRISSLAEIPVITLNDVIVMQTSRYINEFVETGRLGKGGFGSVFKARNRLDGREYAVKKIKFKHRNAEELIRMLREVKALAGLSHNNIVGYNAAWMEHDPRMSSSQSSRSLAGNNEDTSSSSDSEEFDNKGHSVSVSVEFGNPDTEDSLDEVRHRTTPKIFEIDADGCSNQLDSNLQVPGQRLELPPMDSSSTSPIPKFKRQKSANSFFSRSRALTYYEDQISYPDTNSGILFMDDKSEDKSGAISSSRRTYRRSVSLEPIPSIEKSDSHVEEHDQFEVEESPFVTNVRLFIQMELCTHTLADWLSERNLLLADDTELKTVDKQNMHIFRQLLRGVEFIHSHGLIHRDLKPRNIFLQGPSLHVKIGDFGLATEDIMMGQDHDTVLSPSEYKDTFRFDHHTSEVGTSTYAAPEQLEGIRYDSKCDIFSLGVILFEMYNRFVTEMEKHETISNLRNGKLPDNFATNWPIQAKVIQKMTNANPRERPTAKILLTSDLFLSKDQIISNLKEKVGEQEEDIKKLRLQLEERDKLIQDMLREREERERSLLHLQQQLNELKFEDIR